MPWPSSYASAYDAEQITPLIDGFPLGINSRMTWPATPETSYSAFMWCAEATTKFAVMFKGALRERMMKKRLTQKS